MNTRTNLLESLDSLLTRVTKEAEAYSEPGSYVSGTSHPVKDVDDNTQQASSGARTAENEHDAKNAPNRGRVVDEAPKTESNQDDYQTDIGITSKATGEDPASETDHVKDTKQDKGYESDTQHEARADNKSLDGKKYASATEEFWAFAKAAEELGKDLCALIAVKQGNENCYSPTDVKKNTDNKAAGNPNSHAGGVDKGTDKPGRIPAKDEHGNNPSKEAEYAGYDLAGIFANIDLPAEEKRAADIAVVEQIAEVIKLAEDRADKAAEFYYARAQAMAEQEAVADHNARVKSAARKRANAGMMDPAMMAAAGGAGVPQDPAMMAADGGGDEEEVDPAVLEALMGGGGDVPGAEEAMSGMAGGEGDPVAGGEGGEDEAAMLEAVLQELGVSPEELLAAVDAEEGGEGPETGGAAVPPMSEEGAGASKVASWRPKTAADKRAYSEMKHYVEEVVGRARARHGSRR